MQKQSRITGSGFGKAPPGARHDSEKGTRETNCPASAQDQRRRVLMRRECSGTTQARIVNVSATSVVSPYLPTAHEAALITPRLRGVSGMLWSKQFAVPRNGVTWSEACPGTEQRKKGLPHTPSKERKCYSRENRLPMSGSMHVNCDKSMGAATDAPVSLQRKLPLRPTQRTKEHCTIMLEMQRTQLQPAQLHVRHHTPLDATRESKGQLASNSARVFHFRCNVVVVVPMEA